MAFIFRVMQTVPYSNAPVVKDVIASLHSYFTCNLLLGLSILLSYKQFGGRPIECMTPLGFPSAWNEYTEQYCYSSNTYYVPFSEAIPSFGQEEKRSKQVNYYQFLVFFLLFQALCFKLPTLLWKYFAGQSGIKVGEILRLATNESNSEPAMRAENIHSLCVHLQGALRFHSTLKKRNLRPHKVLRPLNLKYSPHYVSLIYLVSKTAFMVNVVVQIYTLSHYLLPDHHLGYGLAAWSNLLIGSNTTWRENLFPRVTLCDFEVREMGQSQNHTIQCVLVLNIFTEKAFLVLWGWYSVLSTITFCNLLAWLYALYNDRSVEHFILNHLEMSGEKAFSNSCTQGLDEIQIQVERFVQKYLHVDGIFILRLIAQHADVVFTTDLIYKLWQSHYAIEKQRETLRLTQKRWQEHIRRFEAIEARERGEGDWPDGDPADELADKFDAHNDYSAFKPLPGMGSSTVQEMRRGSQQSSLLSSGQTSPTPNSRRKLSLVKPSNVPGRLSKKFRYGRDAAKVKSQLRRTMSAESVVDDRFRISSDDDDDSERPRESGKSTNDEQSPKKRASISNEHKVLWNV